MSTAVRFAATILILGIANTANAVIIDLDAAANDIANPITISGLSASDILDVAPIGIAGGGMYDAWNAWGVVAGCDVNGENCTNGWIGNWGYFLDGDTATATTRSTGVYATEAQALAAAQSVGGITGASSISFYIPDSVYSDNIGGMSLNLTITGAQSVPEPGALSLLAVGLLGFGLLRVTSSRRTISRPTPGTQ